MDIKCLCRVAADDVHVREVAIECFDQIAVEFDAEIGRTAGDHIAKKLGHSARPYSELEDDIVIVRFNSMQHLRGQLRRARRNGTDLCRIFEKCLQEL